MFLNVYAKPIFFYKYITINKYINLIYLYRQYKSINKLYYCLIIIFFCNFKFYKILSKHLS
jgi:hypothetical protein